MEITIQYYGMLAEITGRAVENLTVDDNLSVSRFRQEIQNRYPQMSNKKFKVAVNLQISDDEIRIHSGSEVALLPPFAGG